MQKTGGPSVEEMLIVACKALEVKNFVFDVNPSLDKWWSNYKKYKLETTNK